MSTADYPYQREFEAALARQPLAPATIAQYRADLTAFFDDLNHTNAGFAADPQLANIFDRDITTYLERRLANQTMAPNTYNKTLSHLNKYFSYAFSHHLTPELPTLTLHSRPLAKPLTLTMTWLDELGELVEDGQLHFYTRFSLVLLSKGFTASEFLQPGFEHTIASLDWLPFERQFYRAFRHFIAPLQIKQQSEGFFLKQRLDLANPRLTLPALHKYLQQDESRAGFPLAPRMLHQAYVLHYLTTHHQTSDQDLMQTLRLTANALNYYQRLLTQLIDDDVLK